MSGLDCDSCESKLHLAYGEKILTLSSGEKIAVEHTPFLVCDVCLLYTSNSKNNIYPRS